MRIHPTQRKRSMAFGSALSSFKKLRRLPHIFSKVLELPFRADADILVEENLAGFRFVAPAIAAGARFRTQFVEMHPGLMKLVVRNDSGGDAGVGEEEIGVDRWRFRLPASALPALATVQCVGGELVVRVPKGC